MALGDDFIVLAELVTLDFPAAVVRLTTGAVVKWGADIFAADDATFGAVVEADGIDDAIGDLAPGGAMVLAIPDGVSLATVYSSALIGRRVSAWQAEISRATGLVTGTPVAILDAVVDQVRWRPARRELVLELASRATRNFGVNRGNVAGSAHHKSVWPGEKGFDNCTDVSVAVAWGTGGAPRGVTGGGAGGGAGGGGGSGGRNVGVNFL